MRQKMQDENTSPTSYFLENPAIHLQASDPASVPRASLGLVWLERLGWLNPIQEIVIHAVLGMFVQADREHPFLTAGTWSLAPWQL